jgi:hypothetical protein
MAITTVLVLVILVDALMWLIGVPPTLFYALKRRALPELGGIRLMGGPFEALGLDGLIVSGLIFTVVSALKLLAAYWVRAGRLDGAVLELILLGLSAIFWYGFALPLGPIVGTVQVAVLLLAWRSLA